MLGTILVLLDSKPAAKLALDSPSALTSMGLTAV
jgi:hypothetical protein